MRRTRRRHGRHADRRTPRPQRPRQPRLLPHLAPHRGRRDSERNCVSNIRPPGGLAYATAADRIAWLMREARGRGLTGVALKDETRGAAAIAGPVGMADS